MTCRLRSLDNTADRLFDLPGPEHRLGRAYDNDLILDTPEVSRHHAVLRPVGSGLLVEDLGSTNGTFVDGQPVIRSQVPPGSVLRFGREELRLELVHPDDTRLGISRQPAMATEDLKPGRELTTFRLTEEPWGAEAPLRLLEEVACRLLAGGEESLPESLQRFSEDLGLPAVWLCRRNRSGAFELLAAVGAAPEPALLQAFQQTGRSLESSEFPEPTANPAAAASGEPEPEVEILPVPGNLPGMVVAGRPDSGLLLFLEGWDRPSPFDGAAVRSYLRLVRACLDHRLPEKAARHGAGPPGLVFPPGFVAGRSAVMAELYRGVARIAAGDIPILVHGETGVGKEVVARMIHDSSPRRQGPLAAVNCAAIPSELLEAELFGVGRGVATGVEKREGWFARADGGTLFLDEIAEMALPLQAKLLRALEEGTIQPVGEKARAVDIRVVAATNADLRQRVREGSFRADLFYRIAGHEIRIPPLRERAEDIPLLVHRFLDEACRESDRAVTGVTVRAATLLCRYRWPGNVRELQNEVRRLVHLCPPGRAIDSGMLPRHILGRDRRAEATGELTGEPDEALELAPRVARLEKDLIREALGRARGNVSRSARLLGVSRNGLKQKLARHGLDAEMWREGAE